MKYRLLGKTGFSISEISLGTWQVGGTWGSAFNSKLAGSILDKAIQSGINFIDTADVYSDGESERAVGEAIRRTKERIFVATKCGRQIKPHVNREYTTTALRKFVEGSLTRLQLECLDLIQLHCPPTEVYYRPEIFALFDDLKREGKIQNLGVSIEKVEEGLKALEFENVTTIQVIYNMFRQRPQELLFPMAKKKNVGIIVRVPLASGMLTGKFTTATKFGKDDHRNFNRDGAAFDKGETFSGIPYEAGLVAVDKLREVVQNDLLVSTALNWILLRDEVSCIIPGASSPDQVTSNLKALEAESLTKPQLEAIDKIYAEDIKQHVHQLW